MEITDKIRKLMKSSLEPPYKVIRHNSPETTSVEHRKNFELTIDTP